jgi:hypothetical protein
MGRLTPREMDRGKSLQAVPLERDQPLRVRGGFAITKVSSRARSMYEMLCAGSSVVQVPALVWTRKPFL